MLHRNQFNFGFNFSHNVQVVVLSELGDHLGDPNNANAAKVKFTVRTAGQYKISVMIGSTHIAGSPFVRNFLPGPIDAIKSRLARPANTVVCCASASTSLYIEPRDEYGNGCIFKRDIDAIQVRIKINHNKCSDLVNLFFVGFRG